LKTSVAAISNIADGNFFFFWRGRVALYAILKALGVGPGDEVVLPGFTCVAVPNSVAYLGAQPVYADIEPDTYNVSASTIEPRLSPRTRALIVQSSFGLSADLDPIMALAAKAGLPVIEDCAHGLGGSYKGRPNGTVADAAFFSTQWSKPVCTGLGGVALVNDVELAPRVEAVLRTMPRPGIMRQLTLEAQYAARNLLRVPTLYYPLVGMYRWLTQKAGISVGSSSADELVGTSVPDDFHMQMGSRQRKRWWRGLMSLDRKVAVRQETALTYDRFFHGTDVQPPCRPQYAGHAMLRYTVEVPDKPALLRRAAKLRLPIGDWFLSPLHPVTGDLSQWGYEDGMCPHAESACRRAVNLLPDYPLAADQLDALFAPVLSEPRPEVAEHGSRQRPGDA